jgi:hypothetical protein
VVAKRKTKLPEVAPALPADEVEKLLRRLARSGFATWGGGKPKGLDPLVELTPGPDISDYINEDRE